ncbi:MAG: GTPase HflX [Rhodospirillaceae bacterium]|nr:GTPase HflX [Rhodospirillaceae bacterium]
MRHGDRALVLHPAFKTGQRAQYAGGRTPETRLEEASGLARAIDLNVVAAEVVRINDPRPNTLIGSGKVEALAELIAANDIGLVVFDAALTPVQQRNLETAWKVKVIDRTGLILEIFGERARTKEGQMQVELAALSYQRSRLVRSWTHLERQRGGFGFIGGPGESQIEMDRRLIDERIVRIKKDLEDVKRTRALHRQARKRVPYPVVALVGYTNAGKSTLFNRLTKASVMAADLLFATLDPTMRRVHLASGREIILSDTVGFISDLPTELVAAFRATLEEVLEADVILHVRDVAHPETDGQKADVEAVLAGLGLGHDVTDHMFEVLNKIDLLDEPAREALAAQASRDQRLKPISAITGAGIEDLLRAIDERLSAQRVTETYRLNPAEGAAMAWLYAHGEVIDRQDADSHIDLTVRLAPEDVQRFVRQRAGKQASSKGGQA